MGLSSGARPFPTLPSDKDARQARSHDDTVASVLLARFIPLSSDHVRLGYRACPPGKPTTPTLTRPIAAPLQRCTELLGVDLTAIQEAAAQVEPYLRGDGTKVWSLMQLERHLRPDVYGRVRGGYLARRRPQASRAGSR
jgi:hypothetical protein